MTCALSNGLSSVCPVSGSPVLETTSGSHYRPSLSGSWHWGDKVCPWQCHYWPRPQISKRVSALPHSRWASQSDVPTEGQVEAFSGFHGTSRWDRNPHVSEVQSRGQTLLRSAFPLMRVTTSVVALLSMVSKGTVRGCRTDRYRSKHPYSGGCSSAPHASFSEVQWGII